MQKFVVLLPIFRPVKFSHCLHEDFFPKTVCFMISYLRTPANVGPTLKPHVLTSIYIHMHKVLIEAIVYAVTLFGRPTTVPSTPLSLGESNKSCSAIRSLSTNSMSSFFAFRESLLGASESVREKEINQLQIYMNFLFSSDFVSPSECGWSV